MRLFSIVICIALVTLVTSPNAQQSAPEIPVVAPPQSDAPSVPMGDIAAERMPLAGQAASPATSQATQSESSTRIALETALTKLVEKLNGEEKKAEKSLAEAILEFLGKLAALVATILGCFVTYKGLRKIPVVRDNSGILILGCGAVVVLGLFYLLSGLVSPVLYAVVAILILLIALVLAAAHLMKFIDEKYPDVKDAILSNFTEGTPGESFRRAGRNRLRALHEWLSCLSWCQKEWREPELELNGTLAEGFVRSVFKLLPNDAAAPSWRNLDDQLLMPIMTRVTFLGENNKAAELVNIQAGLVVIKEGDNVRFARFDNEGYAVLLTSLTSKTAGYIQYQYRSAES
jgi:hypothetical protein